MEEKGEFGGEEGEGTCIGREREGEAVDVQISRVVRR